MSAFVAGRNHILLSKNALQFTYINAKFQKISVGGPPDPEYQDRDHQGNGGGGGREA